MSEFAHQPDYHSSSLFAEIYDLYDRKRVRLIILHRFRSLFRKRIVVFPVHPDVVLEAEHFEIIRGRASMLLRTEDVLRELPRCKDDESIYDFLSPLQIQETEVQIQETEV